MYVVQSGINGGVAVGDGNVGDVGEARLGVGVGARVEVDVRGQRDWGLTLFIQEGPEGHLLLLFLFLGRCRIQMSAQWAPQADEGAATNP